MVQITVSINDIIPPFGKWWRFFIEFLKRYFLAEKMVYENGFFGLYKKGKKIDGPFCPGCYEEYIKRRLLPPPNDGFYICNINREHNYKDPNYEPAEFELLNKEDER